jgi:hypothetical protein
LAGQHHAFGVMHFFGLAVMHDLDIRSHGLHAMTACATERKLPMP